MRRIVLLVFAAVFAFALAGLAGCGQGERQGQDQGASQAQGRPRSLSQNDGQGQEGGMRVSFIDVGKGDCILLQSGTSAALIDAGYDDTSDDVLAQLRARGVERLEFLIVTHYDRDHVGGVGAIGESIPIDAVYLPAYEGSDKNYWTLMVAIGRLGLPARPVAEKLSLELGDAALDVFPSGVTYVPGTKGEEGNDNDMSLVTTLRSGGDSYLFAGDLEKDGLAAYLDGRHGSFDVVKMPHHGRKCSLTDEFLEDAQPQVAVITDDADDPADKKTLKLLDEAGVDAYRTSVSGTITVQSDGAGHYAVSFDNEI